MKNILASMAIYSAGIGILRFMRKRKENNIRAASWENQQCGFRTGPTQTGLYKRRKELEA